MALPPLDAHGFHRRVSLEVGSYPLLPRWESFRPASYLPLKAKLRLWLLHSHSWLHRYRQLRPPGRPQWATACTPAHRGGTCTWSRWKAAGPPCTRKFWAVVCLISQRRSERACQTARSQAGAPAGLGVVRELQDNARKHPMKENQGEQ